MLVIWFIVFGIFASAGIYFVALQQIKPIDSTNSSATLPEPAIIEPKATTLKQFTGNEFRDLFRTMFYPNTDTLSADFSITGDTDLDQRIRTVAEARGYLPTSIPVSAIVRIENEPRLGLDDLLQPLAADSYRSLRDNARRAGFPISSTSAYRSPEAQRDLFMARLLASVGSLEQLRISDDTAIEQTLSLAAPPGYSRHHTGYTIDLWCEDGSTAFLLSSCYQWISADNYKNAKEYGWIPSYPEGTELQGPEPEPWEYVWVGDAVRG